MNIEEIVEEIEFYRSEDIEFGTYLVATAKWMDINNIPLTKKGVNDNIPSYIINKIKDEVYEDNLLRPSLNINMTEDKDLFTELFFQG